MLFNKQQNVPVIHAKIKGQNVFDSALLYTIKFEVSKVSKVSIKKYHM